MNDTILVKESGFNMILQEYNNSILVFNTLQDSLTLRKKKISYSEMSLKSVDVLHKQGMLINSTIDELQIIRHRANVQKYGGKRLHIFLSLYPHLIRRIKYYSQNQRKKQHFKQSYNCEKSAAHSPCAIYDSCTEAVSKREQMLKPVYKKAVSVHISKHRASEICRYSKT